MKRARRRSAPLFKRKKAKIAAALPPFATAPEGTCPFSSFLSCLSFFDHALAVGHLDIYDMVLLRLVNKETHATLAPYVPADSDVTTTRALLSLCHKDELAWLVEAKVPATKDDVFFSFVARKRDRHAWNRLCTWFHEEIFADKDTIDAFVKHCMTALHETSGIDMIIGEDYSNDFVRIVENVSDEVLFSCTPTMKKWLSCLNGTNDFFGFYTRMLTQIQFHHWDKVIKLLPFCLEIVAPSNFFYYNEPRAIECFFLCGGVLDDDIFDDLTHLPINPFNPDMESRITWFQGLLAREENRAFVREWERKAKASIPEDEWTTLDDMCDMTPEIRAIFKKFELL